MKKTLLLLLPIYLLLASFMQHDTTCSKLPENSILQQQGDSVYESADVDTMASFPGSDPALIKYLTDSCRNVPGSFGGTLYVSFVISSSGIVENAQIKMRSGNFSPQQEAEALRLIMAMRGWKPARKAGKPVAMSIVLPVRIIPK
jgi:Gram-negative bacterial TonB protein C-terminal